MMQPDKRENVVLVGMTLDESLKSELLKSLDELKFLTETAGGNVVKIFYQIRECADSKYFIGSGKLNEIKFECEKLSVNLVIFDEDISPSQQRNLENFLQIKVIDRTALIIDIFALHASSNEAKLQIELAKYAYELPRLRNIYTSFSQQVGMIGTRGPGETQLELDKRSIKKRISALKEKLKHVETQRETQRKQRLNSPNIVFVGYTNAGKSSLLNFLTEAGALVADRLFSTLDSMSRKYTLPNNKKIILTDTVGFINKLPHQLIEAFKTTLDTARYADILIHVVDVSNQNFELCIDAVYKTLDELKISNIPIITFFNKSDVTEVNPLKIHKNKNLYPNVVIGSAKTGKNIDLLINKISEILNLDAVKTSLSIPISKYYLLTQMFDKIQVDKTEFTGNEVVVEIEAKQDYIDYLKRLIEL
ncbi:MAG TPA: GTPase HflX [bacterium]|nr:GTPase HflX [bacterium]HPN32183.1 GTPase HflX [bacterium]